jgi:hypothetical protein
VDRDLLISTLQAIKLQVELLERVVRRDLGASPPVPVAGGDGATEPAPAAAPVPAPAPAAPPAKPGRAAQRQAMKAYWANLTPEQRAERVARLRGRPKKGGREKKADRPEKGE